MYQEFHPSPGLRDLVDLFFSIRLPDSLPPSSPAELIVPDGTMGLLFVQRGNLHRSQLRGTSEVLGESYIFGQKTKSVYYQFNQSQLDVFGAKLKPGAMMKIFGLSPQELTDALLPAHIVLGQKMRELEEQMAGAPEAASRLKSLESFLLQARREKKDKDKLLDAFIYHITRVHGNISVRELASHFHVGYKRLERLFKTYTGLTPKQFCRIIRFNATLYYQKQENVSTLTDLAYSAGYFDQMHFIKEVKSMTNLSPSQFYQCVEGGIAPQQRQHIAAKYI
ncbi:MAG: AraC family transcriptional regulator [Saprospiraceae bacterium]|nr:AraC family transcriptional regulator [Saprospiraceae bacterium]